MARSGPEVADIFRRYGAAYRESHGASLCTAQRRVMSAIEPALNEPVLTPLALKIVRNLMRRRLTDIDNCAAREMLERDLVIAHRLPPERRDFGFLLRSPTLLL